MKIRRQQVTDLPALADCFRDLYATLLVDLSVHLGRRDTRVAEDHLSTFDAELIADSRRGVVAELIGCPMELGFPCSAIFIGRILTQRKGFLYRVSNCAAVCCCRVDVAGFPLGPSQNISAYVVALPWRCLAMIVTLLPDPR